MTKQDILAIGIIATFIYALVTSNYALITLCTAVCFLLLFKED